jgi:hypothetical protein
LGHFECFQVAGGTKTGTGENLDTTATKLGKNLGQKLGRKSGNLVVGWW